MVVTFCRRLQYFTMFIKVFFFLCNYIHGVENVLKYCLCKIIKRFSVTSATMGYLFITHIVKMLLFAEDYSILLCSLKLFSFYAIKYTRSRECLQILPLQNNQKVFCDFCYYGLLIYYSHSENVTHTFMWYFGLYLHLLSRYFTIIFCCL